MVIRNGTCQFRPQAAIQREIHIYDNIMEMHGEPLWQRKGNGRWGRRGNVEGFSDSSRRRLRMAAARVPSRIQPNFFTATYQKEVGYEEAKRHLDNFGKRMLYHYPEMCMIWRTELQQRGVVHYHFLMYGGPPIVRKKGGNKETFAWMRKTWNEVTGQVGSAADQASTRYERLRSMKGVHRYISKYLAKKEQGEGEEKKIMGRQWGIIGRRKYQKLVSAGRRICRVSAELWYELKKSIVAWLVQETGREQWLWGPWWARLTVYGSWEAYLKQRGVQCAVAW